jgi:hypothetical protein
MLAHDSSIRPGVKVDSTKRSAIKGYNGSIVDLYLLYTSVEEYGGWKATTESWGWTEICRQVYTIAIALLFCWHRR